MLRSGHETPILPRAPKKRRLIKLQHEDGVGGSLKLESEETHFDSDSEETFQLLSKVTTKLDELKVKISKNDDLISELEKLCHTVNQQIIYALSE